VTLAPSDKEFSEEQFETQLRAGPYERWMGGLVDANHSAYSDDDSIPFRCLTGANDGR
jgi:hypothetical protein